MKRAKIEVTLKPSVLDPQGKAVEHALHSMGFGEVQGVRIGKMIEVNLTDDVSEARLKEMCEKLLANTVIESYKVNLG